MPSTRMENARIDGLEGLRGLMSFWVWISHVSTIATLPFDKHTGWGMILANGEFAVGVFVILSGFVISLALDSPKAPTYSGFLIRRGFRLFPIYLLSLYVSVLLLQPSMTALQQLPWDGPRTADRLVIFQNTMDYFWSHLFLHTALLHGIIPDKILPSTSFAFMGQAWSLTLEWQFYLIAPVAFFFLSRRKLGHVTHLLVMLATVALSKVFGQPSFLFSMLYLFAIGYFGQRLLKELKQGTISIAQSLQYLAVEAAVLSVTGTGFISFLIWSSVFLAIAFSIQGRRSVILKILESPPIRFLGNISYSFYCLHMVVMYALVYLLIVTLEIRDRDIYIEVLIPSSLLVTLLLSWFTYVTVETPMQNYGRKLVAKFFERRSAISPKRLAEEAS